MTDGKRPNGITLVPWQSGKSLCWDVTVTCPLAESYIDRAALEAGAAAEMAATRKERNTSTSVLVTSLSQLRYRDLGRFNASARHLDDLGRKISANSGEALYQRISILVQRFNAVLQHDSLPATDCTNWWLYPICIFFSIFKLLMNYMYRELKNNNSLWLAFKQSSGSLLPRGF